MENTTLLCAARRRGGVWEASCLDLDIAVEGQTFEEVHSLLNSAISSYIADARQEGDVDRDRLLSRQAPLSVRLAWLWPFIWRALLGRNHGGPDKAIEFQVACPA